MKSRSIEHGLNFRAMGCCTAPLGACSLLVSFPCTLLCWPQLQQNSQQAEVCHSYPTL